jgi:hypothetical protein
LFTGAANLTTDWPLVLFTALMLLISGYHFEEEINYIRNYRIKQQEFAQQQLLIKEKQKNLLMTFNLLAEKEAARNKPAASLTSHLQQMREYYQKEFRKQAKFFSCQYTVEEGTNDPTIRKISKRSKLWNHRYSDQTEAKSTNH